MALAVALAELANRRVLHDLKNFAKKARIYGPFLWAYRARLIVSVNAGYFNKNIVAS